MTSANNEAAEKAKLAKQAAAKEAAAQVADSAESPSASGLVLPGATAEIKAAPVLGAAVESATDSAVKDSLVAANDSAAVDAPKVIAPRTVTVETDKFIMTLSNKGGKVQSVIVKALPDSANHFPELIQDTALGALDLNLGGADLSEVMFNVEAPEWINVENDTTVQFVFTDANGNQLVRSYGFTKAGVAVRQVNKFKGFRVDKYELSWKGGMRETEEFPKGKSFGGTSYFFSEVIFKNNEITERETFNDAMTFDNANYYWVGMRRKYVAMSVQFDSPVPAQVKAKHINLATEGNPDPGTYSLSIADAVRGDSIAYNFMVLPLEWGEVEALGQGYEKIIVTGSKWFPGSSVWFVWICAMLLKLLKFFYSIIPNYGVAIILVTFIVRGITTPFTIKQLKSTSAMSKLKPQLDEINVKYRSDPQKKQAAYTCTSGKWTYVKAAEYLGKCDSLVWGKTKTYDEKEYVCKFTSWVTLTDFDKKYGVCSGKTLGTTVIADGINYICTSSDWSKTSNPVASLGDCTYKDSTVYKTDANGIYYACHNYTWTKVTSIVTVFGSCNYKNREKQVVFNGAEYVCDSVALGAGWHKLSAIDSLRGYCSNKKLGDTITYKNDRYLCKSTFEGNRWTVVGYREFMGECTVAREGHKMFNGINYSVCSDERWEGVTETYKDPRDNNTYRIQKINGVTWMLDNLNYVTADSSDCVNGTSSCGTAGRLYGFSAAKTACPTGWSLPDTAAWGAMIDYVYALDTAYKRKVGGSIFWNPTEDIYGFAMLPTGYEYFFLQNGQDPVTKHDGNTGIDDAAVYWRADGSYEAWGKVSFKTGGGTGQGKDARMTKTAVRCIKED
jgi:uncharacterized protein (TIGR02145 family)